MGTESVCARRIRDKLTAERRLGLPVGRLKAREIAEAIRERHPQFRGRSIWRTIGGFARWQGEKGAT